MYFLIFIIIYVYISLSLMRIAQKGKFSRTWFSWIPVAREYMLINLAGKKWYWIILLFIPFVNIAVSWIIWGTIANLIGRSRWWGRLMIIPFLNLFIITVLAFNLKPRKWANNLKTWQKARQSRNIFKNEENIAEKNS